MAASNQQKYNKYTVSLFDTPVGVTNVHVGDRFVYTGRRHDENLERDFVLMLTCDFVKRECPPHTILKLTNSYRIAFAPVPFGTKGHGRQLKKPQMQYEFEDEFEAKMRDGRKFKCIVSVYDLKHMINTDQLRKIPESLHQTAFGKVAKRRAHS